MIHRTDRFLVRLLCGVLLVTLAACKGSSDDAGEAKVRLLNLSGAYAALDMVTNSDNEDDDEDVVQATGVATGAVSAYTSLDADDYTVKLRRTGASATLRSFAGQQLVDETVLTYVAYSNALGFGTVTLDEALDEADAGDTTFRVMNLTTAGALDVYLTDATAQLPDTTPVAASVSSSTATVTVDSGEYRLRITAAGDNTDIRLDVPAVTLASRGVVTLMLTETAGGVLVNAVVMPQEGQPTTFTNASARVRGAMALSNGAVATLRIAGQSLFTSATAGVIGARYVTLTAGQIPAVFTVNGAGVVVPAPTLLPGRDYTLLAWNDSEGAKLALIDDSNLPVVTSGKSRLRVLNGMSAGGQPLSLSLDYSPVVEGIAVGTASASTEVFAGTEIRLDVTASNTGVAVLTRDEVTLVSNAIYTFFVTQNSEGPLGVLRRDR